MKSIGRPNTPPAALISFTANLAPLAAGRSRDDSSPVRAKPPPTLIASCAGVPPPAVGAGAQALSNTAAIKNRAKSLCFMILSPLISSEHLIIHFFCLLDLFFLFQATSFHK